ncbi:MAG: non-ribosomal peptide synthetase, partial [Marivirga sp.]|nr:non-ribosomal peptide synthetase [Marivirga sp.]
MYFLYEFDKASLAYNMSQLVKLEGDLDLHRLTNAFKNLISRHESLRTSFEMTNGIPVQRIHEVVDFIVEWHEGNICEAPSIIDNFVRPFDLSIAPLVRVGLLKLSGRSHLLMVDMHHIITDGVSQGMLIKDFMALYNLESLPAIHIHYKDYAEWQQNSMQRDRLDAQRQFWKQEFSKEVSVLNLPTDFQRPLVKGYRGGNKTFLLREEEMKRLKALSEAVGATMFMTVLSIFNVLLSKLSNQEDITIGTPVAGRDHADFESIIGMFVNTLALRNFPKGELSFREFLSDVKTKTLSCFGNQSYQYEELIEELNIPRDTSRNPLVDVAFNFLNFEQEELSIPGLRLQPYGAHHTISKFDLTLTATESKGELQLNF